MSTRRERVKDYKSDKMPLLIAGLVALFMFVTFGYQIIRYGNRQ